VTGPGNDRRYFVPQAGIRGEAMDQEHGHSVASAPHETTKLDPVGNGNQDRWLRLERLPAVIRRRLGHCRFACIARTQGTVDADSTRRLSGAGGRTANASSITRGR
jgi:hypothetical protein